MGQVIPNTRFLSEAEKLSREPAKFSLERWALRNAWAIVFGGSIAIWLLVAVACVLFEGVARVVETALLVLFAAGLAAGFIMQFWRQ